jgi:glyoxylase-like metal-dependent hydrolase (beta-lactamase superfamily II)
MPPTMGKNYLKAITEVTDKPVTHVIYSHYHLDHIGAAGMFPKNATFIANKKQQMNYKGQKVWLRMLLWYYCHQLLLQPSLRI